MKELSDGVTRQLRHISMYFFSKNRLWPSTNVPIEPRTMFFNNLLNRRDEKSIIIFRTRSDSYMSSTYSITKLFSRTSHHTNTMIAAQISSKSICISRKKPIWYRNKQ